MKGLSALIQDAEQRGNLHGCRVVRGAPTISHVLFVNDAFLFFRADIEECRTLKHILVVYKEASGQAINYGKSGYVCSNNVAVELSEAISHILGVTYPTNTGRYLGLPSLVGKKKKDIFAHLRDRMLQKIWSWCGKPLSKTSRALFIQFIMLRYFFLHITTTEELQKMLNSFW